MKIQAKKYFGDRAFYKSILAVSVPMMVQNGITNLVNMLDNVMLGTLGTEAMSGASIVNQFIFIFNLLIFGAISAAGIFTAQYFGSKDNDGIRNTFRFKIIITLIATLFALLAFFLFDDEFIGMFLHESEQSGDLALTLSYGKSYLAVMLIGLLPYSFSQCYASTLRETGETVMPMISSLCAVVANFALNLILIFGFWFIPAFGVVGAAIATVASRFIELLLLIIFAARRSHKFPYFKSAFRSFRIPTRLTKQIILKGLPIMLNELLWAIAMVLRNQSYSLRGLDAVAAQNICSTLFNVFSVVYLSLGSAIAIIVGSQLGAADFERAKDTARKMLTFSVLASMLMAVLFALSALIFPKIYNVSESAQNLATYMMVISGLTMPFSAYANATYFTMRSGGQVFVTILFDSVYMWIIVVPLCMILSHLTAMNIFLLYFITQMTEGLKALFGMILLKRGKWVKNLVGVKNKQSAPVDA